jgi:hypothetical protein
MLAYYTKSKVKKRLYRSQPLLPQDWAKAEDCSHDRIRLVRSDYVYDFYGAVSNQGDTRCLVGLDCEMATPSAVQGSRY